ncbi:MAG: AAA family ATPase [Fibrobacterota bacterium]
MLKHMERTIGSKLLEWKESRQRKPLILRGARQVGKSFTLKNFGQDNFKNCVVADFEQKKSLHRVFQKDLVARNLVQSLEVELNQRIIPGETLLFLDEIQACPRALMSLRYFFEEMPGLHVAAAGSLLEFSMEEIPFPVGRVDFMRMHPMSFREFLIARKEEVLLENRPDLTATERRSDSVHDKFMEILKEYFIVGGMPEAVRMFVETGSYEAVNRVHETLIRSYEEDFPKYGTRVDMDCLMHVYEAVPRHLGQQIKYTSLYPEKRIESIKAALKVLERALIIHPVHAADVSGLPLGASASGKIFKQVFVDIGLARQMAGISASRLLNEKDLLHSFRGALAEQYIGQEMVAVRGGSENDRLYYWVSPGVGDAEVDYLMVEDGRILPVEVKSGPAGKLRSLAQYLLRQPECREGRVFHGGNILKTAGSRIRFLPLYTDLRMG